MRYHPPRCHLKLQTKIYHFRSKLANINIALPKSTSSSSRSSSEDEDESEGSKGLVGGRTSSERISLEIWNIRNSFFFKTRENSKFDIKFLTNPNPLAPSTMAKYENFS